MFNLKKFIIILFNIKFNYSAISYQWNVYYPTCEFQINAIISGNEVNPKILWRIYLDIYEMKHKKFLLFFLLNIVLNQVCAFVKLH